MAINSPYLEEETREAPGVVETLLLGNCDPDEFGRPEISPLTSALRIMDTEALCLLLSANANPNRTEKPLAHICSHCTSKCTSSTGLGGGKSKSASEGFLYDTSAHQGREEWPQMGRVHDTRNGK